MTSILIGTVVRHLEGHVPAVSAIIKIPDDILQRNAGDPDMVDDWEEHYILKEAEKHRDSFSTRLVEFRHAKWFVHFTHIGDYGGTPHRWEELE